MTTSYPDHPVYISAANVDVFHWEDVS